jgi:heme-degrading monooxygenase HmoA
MIVEYTRYAIALDRSDEFAAAYALASSALDTSEHCLAYELCRGVEEPENWILRIEWDSIEGHEHGFRSSPEFGPFPRRWARSSTTFRR